MYSTIYIYIYIWLLLHISDGLYDTRVLDTSIPLLVLSNVQVLIAIPIEYRY